MADEPFLLYDLPHTPRLFLLAVRRLRAGAAHRFRSRSYELIRGLVGQKHGYTIHNAAPRTTMAYDGSQWR